MNYFNGPCSIAILVYQRVTRISMVLYPLIALIAGDERREGDTMRNAKAYQKQMGDLNKNNGWLVVDLPL